jgi:hypothetical protein
VRAPRPLALLVIALASGCGAAGSPARDPAADAAGHRGLAWVLSQELPVHSWLPVAVRAYRVTADEATAASLASLIGATLAAHPARCDRDDLESASARDLEALYSLLMELVRCQHEGRDIEAVTARLAPRLREDAALWQLSVGHQLVVAYLLERLQIRAGPSQDALRQTIRAQCRAAAASEQRQKPCELYPLTHVVMTASDYFQQHPDAADFPLEASLFREATRHFRATATDDMLADVIGEVLLCYKLLRIPFDDDARVLLARLVANQNPDGSWGSERLPVENRVHLTAVLTLALLDHTHELRREFGVL